MSSSSSSRDWHWLPRFTANLPLLASTLTLNLIIHIHPILKEQLFRAHTAEPQSYAKNRKTCSMKLVALDMKVTSGNFKWRCQGTVTITACKMKHILMSVVIRTIPQRNLWQKVQCIFSISCKCGKSYTGEMGRQLDMWFQEYRHHAMEPFVAQHADEWQ